MNIFAVDYSPTEAARALCDRHINKMILESAQMLSSALPEHLAPYRRTHYKHRCSVWARQSADNYLWLVEHALALSEEKLFRWPNRPPHKSVEVVEFCRDKMGEISFPDDGLLPFALAVGEYADFSECPVECYREFYNKEKRSFAAWDKGREAPSWWRIDVA